MSEILTFNLPISISRERWDAIIREAARKVYTEGLVDPGEALMPEVDKAATAALMPPPGIVCGGDQQAPPLPGPSEAVSKREPSEFDPDRPIPPDAWGRLLAYVRARSVPTAALLAQKGTVLRWSARGKVYITMAKPFREQFMRQEFKHRLLHDAIQAVFKGDHPAALGTDWIIIDPQNPSSAANTIGKSTEDSKLLDLVNLINSGKWTVYDKDNAGMSLKQPVSVLSVDVDGVVYRICYMMPKHQNILFLSHRQKPVRDILGYGADETLRRWMSLGILIKRHTSIQNDYSRFSQTIPLLGQRVTVCKIDISMLSAFHIPVSFFRFVSP